MMPLKTENTDQKNTGQNLATMSPDPALPRPADEVMRLARLGAFHPMRLSFSRQILRRMAAEKWKLRIAEWKIDPKGYGHALITAETPAETFTLTAFSHALDDKDRSDRVIAEKWDATFSLIKGTADAEALKALAASVPKQEAARQHPSQLTLSRANKSVRLFNHVVDSLAQGRQPDPKMVNQIGYVMRTTAVYGNGKFGIGDRHKNGTLSGAFEPEMLTVYLIRHFSLALVEHLAQAKSDRAVRLDPRLARHFGIGNATGLGMAPFLVNHQTLLHHWIYAREQALVRVLNLEHITPQQAARLKDLIARAAAYTKQWCVDDAVQAKRISQLEEDLQKLSLWTRDRGTSDGGTHDGGTHATWAETPKPLMALMHRCQEDLSLEAQEMLVSLLMEPFGALIDDLGASMAADEPASVGVSLKIADAIQAIDTHYSWALGGGALGRDLKKKSENALFWYVSEAKLEPRLGRRFEEDGADKEMPFDIAHQTQAVYADLKNQKPETPLAAFMLAQPHHRQILRRITTTMRHPYGEIRDNLVAATTRPIDMLRCKLSFFGAAKFDPKSDLWTRITLYQGAPLAEDLQSHHETDDWLFAPLEIDG